MSLTRTGRGCIGLVLVCAVVGAILRYRSLLALAAALALALIVGALFVARRPAVRAHVAAASRTRHRRSRRPL